MFEITISVSRAERIQQRSTKRKFIKQQSSSEEESSSSDSEENCPVEKKPSKRSKMNDRTNSRHKEIQDSNGNISAESSSDDNDDGNTKEVKAEPMQFDPQIFTMEMNSDTEVKDSSKDAGLDIKTENDTENIEHNIEREIKNETLNSMLDQADQEICEAIVSNISDGIEAFVCETLNQQKSSEALESGSTTVKTDTNAEAGEPNSVKSKTKKAEKRKNDKNVLAEDETKKTKKKSRNQKDCDDKKNIELKSEKANKKVGGKSKQKSFKAPATAEKSTDSEKEPIKAASTLPLSPKVADTAEAYERETRYAGSQDGGGVKSRLVPGEEAAIEGSHDMEGEELSMEIDLDPVQKHQSQGSVGAVQQHQLVVNVIDDEDSDPFELIEE